MHNFISNLSHISQNLISRQYTNLNILKRNTTNTCYYLDIQPIHRNIKYRSVLCETNFYKIDEMFTLNLKQSMYCLGRTKSTNNKFRKRFVCDHTDLGNGSSDFHKKFAQIKGFLGMSRYGFKSISHVFGQFSTITHARVSTKRVPFCHSPQTNGIFLLLKRILQWEVRIQNTSFARNAPVVVMWRYRLWGHCKLRGYNL